MERGSLVKSHRVTNGTDNLKVGPTNLHSVQDFFRLKTVNCMLQASQGIFLIRLIWCNFVVVVFVFVFGRNEER